MKFVGKEETGRLGELRGDLQTSCTIWWSSGRTKNCVVIYKLRVQFGEVQAEQRTAWWFTNFVYNLAKFRLNKELRDDLQTSCTIWWSSGRTKNCVVIYKFRVQFGEVQAEQRTAWWFTNFVYNLVKFRLNKNCVMIYKFRVKFGEVQAEQRTHWWPPWFIEVRFQLCVSVYIRYIYRALSHTKPCAQSEEKLNRKLLKCRWE
jgi:ribosomal protein S24E